MNYIEQMEAWIAEHPKATAKELWLAGYHTCLDNWCQNKREKIEQCYQLMKEILS